MSKASTPPEGDDRKRILLVDDHPMMRRGMAQLIAQARDLQVCGEAADAAHAVSAVRALHPDLVVVDLGLPGRSGLELIKDLLAMRRSLPVLVVSMHDETFYAERVLRAGARGYLMKQAGGDELLKAIRQILSGRVYVSDAMSDRILGAITGGRRREQPSSVESLTDRELEVFRLIGQGCETKAISNRLHMSVKTVEAHRLAIKRKLKIRTSAELARRAVLWVEATE